EVGGLALAGLAVRAGFRRDERRPPAAGVVPRAGGLHLDHPGAEIAEHHARVRPGQRPGQVDDHVPGQRPGCPSHGAILGGGEPRWPRSGSTGAWSSVRGRTPVTRSAVAASPVSSQPTASLSLAEISSSGSGASDAMTTWLPPPSSRVSPPGTAAT